MATFLFSPFGWLDDSIPPALCLVTARAAGLVALVLAFKVAARLAGPRVGVAAGAGLVAAVALLLSPEWLRYLAHGNEAPMAVAFMLAAVDRHLDRARRAALVLAFALAVLKPGQWSNLLDRLRKIENPVVPTRPSKFALPVKRKKRGASRAHEGE